MTDLQKSGTSAKTQRRRKTKRIQAENANPLARQMPFAPPKNKWLVLEPLSDEQIELIHQQSLKLISTLGVKVLSPDARLRLKRAGCSVDEGEEIVRMDPAFVEEMVAKAPQSFTLTPRNPSHAITIGGNNINFGLVSGAPNAHDCIRGRRAGNFADFQDLIRLAQSFNCIHFMGNQALSPNDLPANTRHLDSMFAAITLSDKVTASMSIGAGRIRDAAAMLAISRGLSMEALHGSPSAIANINVNSPRVLDKEMSDAALTLAELGQAVVVTPFTLMGAMTPVTFAAALAQQNAEALFTIALIQSQYNRANVIYGGFTSNVDMKSGAPAFGTPENSLANMAGGQLARRYNLPYRTSACNASNIVDTQAAHETQMALWGAVSGVGNLVYHGAGWLEGGLVASFEKLIIDVEMLQMMQSLLSDADFSESGFGFEAIAGVAPGGHFFGSAHTLERYKSAFYEPLTSDWQNSENWAASGSLTATARATQIWQDILKSFEPPILTPAIREELEAYVARRKEDIGTGEP